MVESSVESAVVVAGFVVKPVNDDEVAVLEVNGVLLAVLVVATVDPDDPLAEAEVAVPVAEDAAPVAVTLSVGTAPAHSWVKSVLMKLAIARTWGTMMTYH